MNTLHEVRDTEKVNRLAKAIEENGWQGPPMVADYDCLITGVHRYAALRQLDREAYVECHTIDIRDIVENFDAKIDELMDSGLDWIESLRRILDDLPESTRTEYGMDLH